MKIITQNKHEHIVYENYEFAIKPDIKNSIFEIWAIKNVNEVPVDIMIYVKLGRYSDLGTVTFILNRLRECHEQGAKKVQITSNNVVKII